MVETRRTGSRRRRPERLDAHLFSSSVDDDGY
jgi:hypothetical protein